MTMHAQEWDQEHDHTGHEHDRAGHDHGHDEPVSAARTPEVREPADTGRLYRAAAAGRADVVGAGGMGVLQRAVGNSAVGAMLQRKKATGEEPGTEERSPVHDVVSSGGGAPLDTDTRADMEARMGADFSDVRVHTDSAAHDSAKGVGAHAYTVGNNVVFQRDAYDPASPQGRTTLAHELTHVIQQRNGPVDGTETAGGIRVSDPSDRFEREAVANADRVLADPAPAPAAETPAPAPAPAAGPAAVQRAATEDEDEQPADVQGSFVQRAKEGGEEEEEAPAE
ncbi:DUF4157 domain-containing protein [Streptomyces sp. NPDC059913]|uniref:eCIS core domain-containing protein n=1 Tax=unclassified Streptomyces TaxID=2593676 RepID=UPI0036588A27